MKGGTTLSEGAPAQPRHQLLAFASLWRRTQTMVLYGAGVLVVGTGVTYLDSHRFVLEYLILAAALLLLGVGFHYGARQHYVQLEDDGLRIQGLVRRELVPLAAVRQARTQSLQVLFRNAVDRRERFPRSLRQFERSPVCVVRLDLDPLQVQRLGRVAGRGSAIDQDLILLVADAQQLEQSLQPRIRRRPPAPAAHRR